MNLNSKNLLLTGSHGELGSQIVKSKLFDNLLTPSKQELDITRPELIDEYLSNNDIGFVINCAAYARMALCEEKPQEAIITNVIGTSNLVNSIMKIENQKGQKIRFVHISTDGVYSSLKGNYSEKSATIPYNNYGWTKLGGECAVQLLDNFVIIRTRFFNPNSIPFNNSATDIFTSSIPLNELINAIHFILKSKFVGTVNIGSKRISDFEQYKKYKPSIKPYKRYQITKNLNFEIAKDAAMNCELWYSLKNSSDKD